MSDYLTTLRAAEERSVLPPTGADIFFAGRRTGATGKIGYLTGLSMAYSSCLDADSYLNMEFALDPAPFDPSVFIRQDTSKLISMWSPRFDSKLLYG